MIVEDYTNDRPMIEIEREYGLKARRIYQILRENGVEGLKRKPKDKPVLSEVHRRIGSRLYETYFDRGLLRQQAAEKLGMSSTMLRNVELGKHNLDLFELQDIAAFMKTTVGDLVDGS